MTDEPFGGHALELQVAEVIVETEDSRSPVFSVPDDPFAQVVVDDDAECNEPPAIAVVTLDGQTHALTWPRRAKLLDVLLDNGLDAPFSCREGHCGACAVLMKSGEVDMRINDVLEQSDIDEGLILGCQARPKSESVEVTYDE